MSPVQFGAAQALVDKSVFERRQRNPEKAKARWEASNAAKDAISDRLEALPDGVTLSHHLVEAWGLDFHEYTDQIDVSFITTDNRSYFQPIYLRHFLFWDRESQNAFWERAVRAAERAVKVVGAGNIQPNSDAEQTARIEAEKQNP